MGRCALGSFGGIGGAHGRLLAANSIIRDLISPIDVAVEFFVNNWILFLAAITSGAMLFWPMLSESGGGGSKVNVAEAVRLINREKAVLIDVSEASEFAAGHAAGAKSIPLGSLAGAGDLPKNKSLPVILLCASGARATRAAAILKKQGFESPRVLAGGLAAWREANLPVERAA